MAWVRKSCDECGIKPGLDDKWRCRQRRDGLSLCPTCRLVVAPAPPKAEHECIDCGDVKPTSEFYLDATNRVSSPCKPCVLDRYRLKKYGITRSQIEDMLVIQGGLCAICDRVLDVPSVDHCHSSGAVRGLLCKECNTGLGMFYDDVERMAKAIEYLGGRNG